MKINKKKGILFWITGLSGSGKSSIASLIKVKIEKKYGPTIICSGDDLRYITSNYKYDKKDRLEFSKTKFKFYKFITEQNVNLIFSTISLFESVRSENKKKIANYVEIFIDSNLKDIVKKNKKKLYKKKNEKIWGIHIKPEFPKNADIEIKNDLKVSLKKLSNKLLREIDKVLKK